MAFKRDIPVMYVFSPASKAAMVMVLEQFGNDLTTIHELKNMLMVDGGVLLDSHYAVLLARLVAPHYPAYADKLLAPLETHPALTPNQAEARRFELIYR